MQEGKRITTSGLDFIEITTSDLHNDVTISVGWEPHFRDRQSVDLTPNQTRKLIAILKEALEEESQTISQVQIGTKNSTQSIS
jgi:hypothetical protein